MPDFLASLNVGHWIAIVAILVGCFFGTFTVLNYLGARRERKLKTDEAIPNVKATINRKAYGGGWRSVQLHIIPTAEQQNFKVQNWRIIRARLLRPWFSAILARAANDDYATGDFDPDNPTRVLDGKAEGRPQRFALEFFIRFEEQDDIGQWAKFKVTYSHVSKRRAKTVRVWAQVPPNAETE